MLSPFDLLITQHKFPSDEFFQDIDCSDMELGGLTDVNSAADRNAVVKVCWVLQLLLSMAVVSKMEITEHPIGLTDSKAFLRCLLTSGILRDDCQSGRRRKIQPLIQADIEMSTRTFQHLNGYFTGFPAQTRGGLQGHNGQETGLPNR